MFRGWRFVAGCVLLLLVLAMCFHYPTAAARHDPYPSEAKLHHHYEAHVGEPVYLWGRVLSQTEDGLVILSDDIQFTIEGAPPDVGYDDSVQVYGTLRPGHRINAERVVVSDVSSLRDLYAVSALAVLLTVGAFFRYWTVDWDRFVFTEREDGRRG